jgi:hypothetical protein
MSSLSMESLQGLGETIYLNRARVGVDINLPPGYHVESVYQNGRRVWGGDPRSDPNRMRVTSATTGRSYDLVKVTSATTGRTRWVKAPEPRQRPRYQDTPRARLVDTVATPNVPRSLSRGESTEDWFARMERERWAPLGRKIRVRCSNCQRMTELPESFRGRDHVCSYCAARIQVPSTAGATGPHRGPPLPGGYDKWQELRRKNPELLRDWLTSGRYSPPPEVIWPEAQLDSEYVEQFLQRLFNPGQVRDTSAITGKRLTQHEPPDAATAAYTQAKEHEARGIPVYRGRDFDPSADLQAQLEQSRREQAARSRRASVSSRRAGQDAVFGAITEKSNYYRGLEDPYAKLEWLKKYDPKLRGHPGYQAELRKVKAEIDSIPDPLTRPVTEAERKAKGWTESYAASTSRGRARRKAYQDRMRRELTDLPSHFVEGAIRRRLSPEEARQAYTPRRAPVSRFSRPLRIPTAVRPGGQLRPPRRRTSAPTSILREMTPSRTPPAYVAPSRTLLDDTRTSRAYPPPFSTEPQGMLVIGTKPRSQQAQQAAGFAVPSGPGRQGGPGSRGPGSVDIGPIVPPQIDVSPTLQQTSIMNELDPRSQKLVMA